VKTKCSIRAASRFHDSTDVGQLTFRGNRFRSSFWAKSQAEFLVKMNGGILSWRLTFWTDGFFVETFESREVCVRLQDKVSSCCFSHGALVSHELLIYTFSLSTTSVDSHCWQYSWQTHARLRKGSTCWWRSPYSRKG